MESWAPGDGEYYVGGVLRCGIPDYDGCSSLYRIPTSVYSIMT